MDIGPKHLKLVGSFNDADEMPNLPAEAGASTPGLVEPWKCTAREDMEHQFEEADGYAYNASRMWRSVGSPDGCDPRAWMKTAEPLLSGLAGYFANLEMAFPDSAYESDFVSSTVEETIEFTGDRIGDKMMTFLAAHAYAWFLDSEVERMANPDRHVSKK